MPCCAEPMLIKLARLDSSSSIIMMVLSPLPQLDAYEPSALPMFSATKKITGLLGGRRISANAAAILMPSSLARQAVFNPALTQTQAPCDDFATRSMSCNSSVAGVWADISAKMGMSESGRRLLSGR